MSERVYKITEKNLHLLIRHTCFDVSRREMQEQAETGVDFVSATRLEELIAEEIKSNIAMRIYGLAEQ